MLAVALLVIAVPKLLAGDLRGELDDTLRQRAADVARLNATAPGELTTPGALEGGGLRAGRGPRRPDRRALGALGGRVLPVDERVQRTASRGSPTRGSAPTRCASTRRRSASSGAARRRRRVVVASDLAGIEHTLDRTRTLIALCALVAARSPRRSPRCSPAARCARSPG